jgi:hypothetical protein
MWCNYCQQNFDDNHWGKSRKNCKKYYADYEKKRRQKKKNSMTTEEWSIYQKSEYRRRAPYHRYRALLSKDKNKGLEFTLTFDQYKILCLGACNWCYTPSCGGVDRLDSEIGHTLDNVVPCCEKCNILLTNLPWGNKSLLAGGLRKIRENGGYDKWQVPYKQCN